MRKGTILILTPDDLNEKSKDILFDDINIMECFNHQIINIQDIQKADYIIYIESTCKWKLMKGKDIIITPLVISTISSDWKL